MNITGGSTRVPQFGARYSLGQKAQMAAGTATITGGVVSSAAMLGEPARGHGGDPFMGAMDDSGRSSMMTSLIAPFAGGSGLIGQVVESADMREKVKDPEATVKTPEDRIQVLQQQIEAEQKHRDTLNAKADAFIQKDLNREFGGYPLPLIINNLFSKQPIVTHDTLEEKVKAYPALNEPIEKAIAALPQESGMLGRWRHGRQAGQVRDEAVKNLVEALTYLEKSGMATASHHHEHGFRFTTLTELGVTMKNRMNPS